jgi:bifunctional DNA-binding transcriptional regulator/antitoxin component of YhaV-PrlF toxin-antitoxin module
MIAPLVPGVVPGAAPRPQGRTAARRGRARARGPLPLVEVPTPRAGTAVYGVAALDVHGRIADRAVLRALGWEPGARLEIAGSRDAVTVRACPEGGSAVTPQGHVRPPAPVRHAAGLRPGDRVLLVADPDADSDSGVLRVLPPATVDRALASLDGASGGAR